MLEIRIGYGDVVSGQMGIPMSASDFEAAKKILDEGKNGNQPVTVRSLVSPVQPLSEMITGMDYGDETRGEGTGLPGFAAAAYDKERTGYFFRGA